MCARFCRRSLVITRNEESQSLLSNLGVPNEFGTDTAWTFEPHPPEYGAKGLERGRLGRPNTRARSVSH